MDWPENYAEVRDISSSILDAFPLNLFHFFNSRKPFELKIPMIIYNFGLTALNFYIAMELLIPSITLKYNYICEPCRQVFSKGELRVNFVFFVEISNLMEKKTFE